MAVPADIRRLILPHGSFRVRVLVALVRYHWFVRLRWIMAGTAVVLLGIERLLVSDFRRPPAVAICIGILAVVNVVWLAVGQRLVGGRREDAPIEAPLLRRVAWFVNAQMTVDLLILTVILRYSGGIESPMAVFYLFHMLIAALLLRPFNALLQGGWAVLLYGALGIGEAMEWIVPHYPFMVVGAGPQHVRLDYVLAGIAVLAAGIFGTLYFTLQISSRLDAQERELEAANFALRQSEAAIRDLQVRRSRFMRTAAHQLKSPLTGIETLAGLLRDGVAPPEVTSGVVGRIIGRCREAMVQVTELLTLARVQEAAPHRHRSASTDVEEVVRQAVDRFATEAQAKGIALVLSVHGCRGCRAAVDSDDLQTCVSNLVDNAIKYTPENGHVHVIADCRETAIRISVEDTGIGIAEESADDIFDPFRRGNLALSKGIPGSGLGLAIVREVVEQAQGRIEVETAPGRGSRFTISIPRHGARPEGSTVPGAAAIVIARPKPVAGGGDEEVQGCSTES